MSKHSARHTRSKSRGAEEDTIIAVFLASLPGEMHAPPDPDRKRVQESDARLRSAFAELDGEVDDYEIDDRD